MVYSLAGCLASALVTYWLGRMIGRSTVERFAGSGFNLLMKRLRTRGVLTIFTVRLLPIAPFTVVNLVMGVSGIRLRDYVIGTMIGMAPGIAAISVFESRVEAVIRRPDPGNLVVLALITVGLAAGLIWLHRRLTP
jgi:uncharacterized membrane protein YdjX (TVP38/TMEM64 family)